MAECWTCGAERASAIFCTSCGKIQPVSRATSYFEMLGFPRRMSIELDALDRAYRDLSRKVHPDRFGLAPSVERRLALEQATRLNDAVRALKNPRKRAEYLLQLRGVQPDGEEARSGHPLLLSEILDLQDQVQSAGGRAELEPIRRAAKTRRDGILACLAQTLDEGSTDAMTREGSRSGSLDQAVMALTELRFVERLLEQIDLRFEEVM